MLILNIDPPAPYLNHWRTKPRQQQAAALEPLISDRANEAYVEPNSGVAHKVLSNPPDNHAVPALEALVFGFKARPYSSLQKCRLSIPRLGQLRFIVELNNRRSEVNVEILP